MGSSNKRNKSIVKGNRRSCQNTLKEAWTGKSSIFTSREKITPFWMYLWGQRGPSYDACTIYWGRRVQYSWSVQKTPKNWKWLQWHCAFVSSKPHTQNEVWFFQQSWFSKSLKGRHTWPQTNKNNHSLFKSFRCAPHVSDQSVKVYGIRYMLTFAEEECAYMGFGT